MKIKVCGIKDQDNLEQLCRLDIDLIGYNFYPSSKRYVTESSSLRNMDTPSDIKKVGVFVNASIGEIETAKKRYGLDYLQLHGDEDSTFVSAIRSIAPVIKVFRVTKDFDFGVTDEFGSADYFLFDTYTKDYGGSGHRFDWDILESYSGSTSFFLAGGLGPEDVRAIKSINHPQLYALDINSRFEIKPGLKDIAMVSNFVDKLKSAI